MSHATAKAFGSNNESAVRIESRVLLRLLRGQKHRTQTGTTQPVPIVPWLWWGLATLSPARPPRAPQIRACCDTWSVLFLSSANAQACFWGRGAMGWIQQGAGSAEYGGVRACRVWGWPDPGPKAADAMRSASRAAKGRCGLFTSVGAEVGALQLRDLPAHCCAVLCTPLGRL